MGLHCPKSPACLLHTLLVNLHYAHLSGRREVVGNNEFSIFHSRLAGQSINYNSLLVNEKGKQDYKNMLKFK